MDLIGELGHCQEFLDLFTQAGYAVELTTPRCTIRMLPIRATCFWGVTGPLFWPYALYHFLRLHSMTIHDDQVNTPYKFCSGRKPNLSRLGTFG
jgi:hypothetical protein